MNNTYLALTIGPIYDTIHAARRTRAVWAASFFFSWFIKQILIQAKSKERNLTILLPYNETIEPSNYGSGLYADRIYFQQDDSTNEGAIQNIVGAIILGVSQDIAKNLTKYGGKITEIQYFLKDYLNVHIVSAQIGDSDNIRILEILNALLDNRELHRNFAFCFEPNYLAEYLTLRTNQETLLTKDGFGDCSGMRQFRSIPEIAAETLRRLDNDKFSRIVKKSFDDRDEEFEIIKKFQEEYREKFRAHHKYYAVLYADGDNIGTLLQKLGNCFEKLQKFSKKLIDFGLKAEHAIAEYGGRGIYLGGEDILAFLPLACVNEDGAETRTMFYLIEQLDKDFADTIGAYAIEQGVKTPTLSYGIMGAYAKHPLKEAMNSAYRLLYKAKDKPCKNSIGLRFQKHSGQYMECVIEKSKTCTWDQVRSLVHEYTNKAQLSDKQEGILSGVIQKFKDELFFTTLALAARAGKENLQAVFENFFNEDIHSEKEKAEFLAGVFSLTEKTFNDYSDDKDARNLIFTVLRLIHFINAKTEN